MFLICKLYYKIAKTTNKKRFLQCPAEFKEHNMCLIA